MVVAIPNKQVRNLTRATDIDNFVFEKYVWTAATNKGLQKITKHTIFSKYISIKPKKTKEPRPDIAVRYRFDNYVTFSLLHKKEFPAFEGAHHCKGMRRKQNAALVLATEPSKPMNQMHLCGSVQ